MYPIKIDLTTPFFMDIYLQTTTFGGTNTPIKKLYIEVCGAETITINGGIEYFKFAENSG